MESKVRSTESQFCVRGSDQNVACSDLSQDVPTNIPHLPSFGCPTTTPSISESTEMTNSTTENVAQVTDVTTHQGQNVTGGTNNQGCCGPGYYALIVIIIVLLLILLVVIYLRCRRRPKLHAKYHTSKVEEANGTKIQNSAEAVPLKSHNWAED